MTLSNSFTTQIGEPALVGLVIAARETVDARRLDRRPATWHRPQLVRIESTVVATQYAFAMLFSPL